MKFKVILLLFLVISVASAASESVDVEFIDKSVDLPQKRSEMVEMLYEFFSLWGSTASSKSLNTTAKPSKTTPSKAPTVAQPKPQHSTSKPTIKPTTQIKPSTPTITKSLPKSTTPTYSKPTVQPMGNLNPHKLSPRSKQNQLLKRDLLLV